MHLLSVLAQGQHALSMAATVLSTEGKIPFAVGNDTFYTWYKVVGDLASATQRPVVALHGGPGLVHNYLLPISDLANRGYPVIFYDQIGNGQSSYATDKPDEFWTIDLMIDELMNVLRHFNIETGFDLVGHSWGGILASEFLLRRQPSGLKHLVLSNSMANMETYEKSVGQLAAKFPEWVREGMTYPQGDPRYRAAFVEIFSKHACRADPPPPEFWYSCDQGLNNTRVHDALCEREDGDLRHWSIEDRLHEINVPTLVINGKYDVVQDFVVEPFFKHIPRVKWVRFENSSHTPFWEERERYMELVGDFIGY